MSSHTIASLPRISSTELSQVLLANASSNLDAQVAPADIAIVDVRDDDHVGGHIKHSIHAPSSTLDHKIPELVRKLKDKDTVVFHCALSQQRGPSAALQYIRERDRLLGLSAGSGSTLIGRVLEKNAEDKNKKKAGEDKGDEDADADGEWEDVKDEQDDSGADGAKKPQQQKVYVLDRGFVGWQERYGEDSRLTEGYRKEIWKDGY